MKKGAWSRPYRSLESSGRRNSAGITGQGSWEEGDTLEELGWRGEGMQFSALNAHPGDGVSAWSDGKENKHCGTPSTEDV